MSSLFTEIRDAATQRGAKGACYLSSLRLWQLFCPHFNYLIILTILII